MAFAVWQKVFPTVTNGTLSVLRRILDIAVDSGARYDNPAKDKDVKRARVRRKELQLPEPDQFLALVPTFVEMAAAGADIPQTRLNSFLMLVRV
jgi:hypothetical protein